MKRTYVLPLLLVAITGCGSNGPLQPATDDGSVGGAGGACAPQSCSNQPVPAIACASGTAPTFDCVRGNDGQCRWSAPRCPGPDGGASACTSAECGPQPALGACPQCGADCAPLVCKRASTGKCGWAFECLKWYATCGDPVCGQFRRDANVPLCTTEQKGAVCPKDGGKCQVPNDACNGYLVCSAADPKANPGGCPISRASYKRDIRYLDPAELRRYHDELLELRLATWRYKQDPERERLGFIIDDHEHSVAVDPARDTVDLYGYTSLAVATLQLQAREIADLRARLADLERRMKPARRR